MHQLYIMRHGMAQSQAPKDELRPLTQSGAHQAFDSAQQYLANIKFDYVFVSPYLRAQQTFSQVEAASIQFSNVQTVDWATPDVPAQPAIDALMALPGKDLSVLVVCHQTFAGRLATLLCDGHERGMHLDTANIVKIEAEIFASQCGIFQEMFAN